MGAVIATSSYSEKQIEVSKLAKAIAHPARIAILELLNNKDCTCNDIVNVLPLAQSTVSQHLKELKKVNLINGSEMPPKTIYGLNTDNYQKLQQIFNQIF